MKHIRQLFDYGDIAYLDNGATTQMPISLLDKLYEFEKNFRANVHRGSYTRAAFATQKYEGARKKIAEFINAKDPKEVIFTSGTTDSLNLVVNSFVSDYFFQHPIVITGLEHHSNIVPFLLNTIQKDLLRVVPVDDDGNVDLDFYAEAVKPLNNKEAFVSISHVSNTLGTIQPVKKMIEIAREQDCTIMIDGAQAIAHMPVNVQDLDVDFYAFSGHKMYGPTGIGVLYGKEELLEKMYPIKGGGDMIDTVSFEKVTFNDLPWKFEAGTPNITGAYGLGEAAEWLSEYSWGKIIAHENELLAYAEKQLKQFKWLHILGNPINKVGIISMYSEKFHGGDIAAILDIEKVCLRDGHHCTQPLMDRFDLDGTIRCSFGIYNTIEDVDKLISGLHRVEEMLG